MAEDKGFKPTPKRLREARKRGQVLKSPLLSQMVALLGGGTALWLGAGYIWVRIRILIEYCLVYGFQAPQECFSEAFGLIVTVASSCLICVAAGAIAGEYLQIGWKFEPAILAMRWERVSLTSGLKRMWTQIPQLWIGGCKVGLLLCLGFMVVNNLLHNLLSKVSLGVSYLQGLFGTALIELFAGSVVVLGVGGALEYALRHRQFYRELSMSLDEVRREHREEEGDPHLRSARRSLHESLMMQDLVSRVRKSKVIVVKK